MKMNLLMKKTLAWTLTAAVIMSMNVPVFAAETKGQDTGEVIEESVFEANAGIMVMEEQEVFSQVTEENTGNSENDAALIGDVTYDSLADAVLAAEPNEKIVLLKDLDITDAGITIPSEKKIILDLSGKSIKVANTKSGHFIVEGDLSLEDSTANTSTGVGNGKIYSETDYINKDSGYSIIEVVNSGSFTMNSGWIYTVRNNPSNNGNFGISVIGNATATINNGKIEAGWYAIAGNGSDSKDTTININGGELISTGDYAIYHPGNNIDKTGCALNIDGGVIKGAAGAVAMRGGTLSVTDGKLSSDADGYVGEWSDGTSGMKNAVISMEPTYASIKAVISGGAAEGEKGRGIYCKGLENREISVDISGGSIKTQKEAVRLESDVSFAHTAAKSVNVSVSHNAQISSTSSPAVFILGKGAVLNVSGGTVQGSTGIEMRSGDINVSGQAKISGTANPESVNPNPSGSTTDGAGIAVAQHTTKQAINVNISGGDIRGTYGFYESNPQQNPPENMEDVNVKISGGTFTGSIGAVYSENHRQFISGGVYSHLVQEDYLASGYETAALSDGTYAVQPIYVYIPSLVSAVSVSPSSIILEEGSSQVLSASVSPANADNQALSWTSSDSGIAGVSGGTVTAAAPGTAVITATSTDGSNVSGSCTVTVTKKAENEDPVVPGKKPVIVEVEPKVKDDGTVEIPESIPAEQADAIKTAIETATENNYVVIELPQSDGKAPAVTSDIIAKAVESSADTLQIKTSAIEGDTNSIEATFTIDVSAGTNVDAAASAINTGIKGTLEDDAQKVVDEKLPADAAVMKLELDHSGPFPVPVKITLNVSGKFKAGNIVYLYYINKETGAVELVGGAPLTVAEDGTVSFTLEHASSYVISDKPEIIKASGIVLDKDSVSIKAGGKVTLKATVEPADTSDKTIKWSTSNSKVAAVDNTGTVTGAAAGKASITAETSNGLTAVCNVTVTVSKLSSPVNVKAASAGYNSIKVNWKKVPGATKYYVYRAAGAKGKYKRIGSSGSASYTDKKLTTGKNYYYKVRAGYNKIYSGYSKAAGAYPKPTRPSVTAKAGKNSITLTWKKVSGATGYTVYRAVGKNGKYTKVKVITSGKTVKYADKKLKSKKNYYYKVRANRKEGKKTIQSSSSKIAYGKTK